MGQDLLKLELGGPLKGGEKQQGGQEPKAPAPEEQSTSSDPKPQEDEGGSEQESPSPPPPPERPEPSKQESKPSLPPKELPQKNESSPKPQESRKPESKPKDSGPVGNREERRVSVSTIRQTMNLLTKCKGKNEPHALTHLRASKTVSEYCSFSDNI